MPWNMEEHNGFSKGTPWIITEEKDPAWTLEEQKKNPDSVWNHYRKLIALRKEHEVIATGTFIPLLENVHGVIAYQRKGEAEEALVITSLLDEAVTIELEDAEGWKPELSSYPDLQKAEKKMTLRPYESILYFRSRETEDRAQ